MAEVDEERNISTDLEDYSGSESGNEKEELDPRVQEELEHLNTASDEINKLETELEKSRAKFRNLLSDSTQQLNLLYKKLGQCVNKARPYFALLKDLQKAQAEAQKAVVQFQRANSVYKAAREMVALAEERVVDPEGNKRDFDSAWQEMLNHATTKFMESEVEKAKSEQEHMQKAAECSEIEKRLKFMEKEWHRSIPKSRPYFELKEKAEYLLAQEKQNVEDLQLALSLTKQNYKDALSRLEEISEEVHRKRQFRKNLPPRTPGVGAENDSASISSDLPPIYLDGYLDRSESYSDLKEWDVRSEDSCSFTDGTSRSGQTDSPTSSSPVISRRANNQGSPVTSRKLAVPETKPRSVSPLAFVDSHKKSPMSEINKDNDPNCESKNSRTGIAKSFDTPNRDNTHGLEMNNTDISKTQNLPKIAQAKINYQSNTENKAQESSQTLSIPPSDDFSPQMRPNSSTVQVQLNLKNNSSQTQASTQKQPKESSQTLSIPPSDDFSPKMRPQATTVQVQLKLTNNSPQTPTSTQAHMSVLSVLDLLAGEPCERVNRQIKSVTQQKRATETMRYVDNGHKVTSEKSSGKKSHETEKRGSSQADGQIGSYKERSAANVVNKEHCKDASGDPLNKKFQPADKKEEIFV